MKFVREGCSFSTGLYFVIILLLYMKLPMVLFLMIGGVSQFCPNRLISVSIALITGVDNPECFNFKATRDLFMVNGP